MGNHKCSRMKILDGQLAISKISQSNGEKYISIEVKDNKSRSVAIRVRCDLLSFAEAITGLGYVDCKAELNDSEIIGKEHQIKDEIVTFPCHSYQCKNKESWLLIVEGALAPYETDGWKGRVEGADNQHRWIGKNLEKGFTARITFERYVGE